MIENIFAGSSKRNQVESATVSMLPVPHGLSERTREKNESMIAPMSSARNMGWLCKGGCVEVFNLHVVG